MTDEPIKRPRGRPRKNPNEREEMREAITTSPRTFKMRAAPNWEVMDSAAEDTPDRYRIRPELIPEGMSAVWVTNEVLGQPVPQHRAEYEKKGWTPVHGEDFDGQFDGMFMPKGAAGEIKMDGLVLMMRPKEITKKAELRDRKKAYEQVAIKEQALRGGDVKVSLDAQHPSALNSNKINKSYERISIPED